MQEIEKAKIWTDIDNIEASAMIQIIEATKHPMLYEHIAIMPDVHAGIGCTIGSVLPLKDAIIPSCIGVDIGCGMFSLKTNLVLEDIEPKFAELQRNFSNRIPMGLHRRDQIQTKFCEKNVSQEYKEEIQFYERFYESTPVLPQLGTLGGGNHFIELQKDSNNNIWIMLHSGSRNIGNRIAGRYMKRAKEMTTMVDLPAPQNMEYFPIGCGEFEEYIKDMKFAKIFAHTNREIMMLCIKEELQKVFKDVMFFDAVNIPHNYVELEEHFGNMVWVHRKGATRAELNELGIIPGSQGTYSYIIKGKGNPDSFNSCSHGAGRKMSRNEARGRINRRTGEYKSEGKLNVVDFEYAMRNVYSESIDRDHLDEAPGAYKDIDVVMNNQRDLVEIMVKLEPVFNMKGPSNVRKRNMDNAKVDGKI